MSDVIQLTEVTELARGEDNFFFDENQENQGSSMNSVKKSMILTVVLSLKTN